MIDLGLDILHEKTKLDILHERTKLPFISFYSEKIVLCIYCINKFILYFVSKQENLPIGFLSISH